MGWRNVPLADTVTATETGIGSGGEGVIVGSPPVWKDDSDATYASFGGHYFGNGNPQFFGTAFASVDASTPPLGGLVLDVRVRARLARESGTNLQMPAFHLMEEVADGRRVVVRPTDLTPLAPTWVAYPFLLTAEAAASFADRPDLWTLGIYAPSYVVPGVPNELQRWQVYEARLEVKVRSDAPPCRLFPREDGLGVGSGRKFPPPKSQQRSGRRFGYY